jgi:hypothetical protein
MSKYNFPDLKTDYWLETRKTLQLYSQLLSDIKKNYFPHQKNWEEHSLNIYAKGLTTGTIPVTINDELHTLDLNLNFYENQLKIFCNDKRLSVDLVDNSPYYFAREVTQSLNDLGIDYNLPENKFTQTKKHYSHEHIIKYWNALKQIYFIMLSFKGTLLYETSNINFWPHHFDLAMLVFSSKLVDGVDTNNWSSSREQMNFGFSSGDEGIPEPYFYITAYPFDEQMMKKLLASNAYWQTEGWKGAVMKYNELVGKDNPDKVLLDFFKFVLKICFNT